MFFAYIRLPIILFVPTGVVPKKHLDAIHYIYLVASFIFDKVAYIFSDAETVSLLCSYPWVKQHRQGVQLDYRHPLITTSSYFWKYCLILIPFQHFGEYWIFLFLRMEMRSKRYHAEKSTLETRWAAIDFSLSEWGLHALNDLWFISSG